MQTITDYKGDDQGQLHIAIDPCDTKGNELPEDYFVDDPSELLHKPYSFKVSFVWYL